MNALLLSHHAPSHYDRCFRIGGRHVCRRCAVLYPLAFAVAIASLCGLHWPEAWDRTLLFLLPLPVTLEFVIERLGGMLAAPSLRRGLGRYWAHQNDRLFWGMVLLFGGSALCALVFGRGDADQSSRSRST